MEEFKTEQKGMEINLSYFFRTIMKKWWALVLAAIIFGGAGAVISEKTKDILYSSSLAFVVDSKIGDSTSSDINSSIKIANTYARIISGKSMANMVGEITGFDPEWVMNSMSTSCTSENNIVELKVVTDNANNSYLIAKAVVQCYSTVVDQVAFTNSTITVFEQPEIPTRPISDNTNMLYGLLAAMMGIVLMVIVLFVANAVRDTVLDVETIHERIDLNILGIIEKMPSRKLKKGKRPILGRNETDFAFNEAFKMIRTKIERISAKNSYKKFMVTSTISAEGKTTVSINLSISLAQNGYSVLLVDADLRCPAICSILDLENVEMYGLADVLTGKITIDKAIKYVEKYNLFVLAGAEAMQNSSELLSKSELDKIIKNIEGEFDYIIFDTTPTGIVTDAVVIGKVADAAVFVISENRASVSQISSSVSDIADSGVDIVGCVYNGSTTGAMKSYGYVGKAFRRRNGASSYYYDNYGRYGNGTSKNKNSKGE